MPSAARLSDIGGGHGCFPSTPILQGSPNVFFNGLPAAREGDLLLPHFCPCPAPQPMPHGILHMRTIAKGSKTVTINGKAAARKGDKIDCGGTISAGSGNILIGDTPYKSPAQKCVANAVQRQLPFLDLEPAPEPLSNDWVDTQAKREVQQLALEQSTRQDKSFCPVCEKMKQK